MLTADQLNNSADSQFHINSTIKQFNDYTIQHPSLE